MVGLSTLVPEVKVRLCYVQYPYLSASCWTWAGSTPSTVPAITRYIRGRGARLHNFKASSVFG